MVTRVEICAWKHCFELLMSYPNMTTEELAAEAHINYAIAKEFKELFAQQKKPHAKQSKISRATPARKSNRRIPAKTKQHIQQGDNR